MRRLLVGLLLWGALCGGAAASPIQLYGTVGKAPVFLDISHVGDTVSGWYVTLSAGKQIRLDGKLDPAGAFQIDEYSANTNERIGTFSGRRKEGHWSGTWHGVASRKSLPVSFDELRSKLTEISGRYRCTGIARDSEFGITVTEALELKIIRGRVKSLALSRSQKSDGEEQSCRIPPGQLRQVSAPVGVLLRARADNGSPHCTIRLYRAGDYLVVKPGDSSQAGDDCRSAGSAHFCSPNGFWSDLVLNRKTQTCRPVR